MSKHNIIDVWKLRYDKKEDVCDYAGRLIKKSACGDPNSNYHPTLDHIRPLSKGGKYTLENIIICHRDTNEKKQIIFLIGKQIKENFMLLKLKILHFFIK